MIHEKRLSIICEMLREFDRQTGNKHAEDVIHNPKNWKNPDALATDGNFYQNAAALLIETLETLDKKTVKDRTIVAALNRFIRRNEKGMHKFMDGVFEADDDGGKKRYVVTDGRLLVRLNNDYASLQRATNAPDSERVNRIFLGVNTDGETLNLPTIQELRTFMASNQIKIGKKTTYPPYCLENSLFVDAENLLTAIQSLPGCVAYKPQNIETPIYLAGSNGDGLLMLMPVDPAWAERQYSAAAVA